MYNKNLHHRGAPRPLPSGRSAPLPPPDADLAALRALFDLAARICAAHGLRTPPIAVRFGRLPRGRLATCRSRRYSNGAWTHDVVASRSLLRLGKGRGLSLALHETLHATFPSDGHEGRWAEWARRLNEEAGLPDPIRVIYPHSSKGGFL